MSERDKVQGARRTETGQLT